MTKLLIPIDIFNQDILFYCCSITELTNDIANYIDASQTQTLLNELTGNYLGRTVSLPDRGVIIYLPTIPTNSKGYAVLAHEIFHAAYLVLDKAGVRCTDSSDEAYAYLIQFLTEKILTSLSSSRSPLTSDATSHTVQSQTYPTPHCDLSSQLLE